MRGSEYVVRNPIRADRTAGSFLVNVRSGKWADFVVLSEDPLADIRNMRSIESVWIAGNLISGSPILYR